MLSVLGIHARQTDFNIDLNIKELDMLFFALPDAIPQEIYQAPIVIAANTSTSSTVRKMTYGVCELFYSYNEWHYERAQDSGESLGATVYMTHFLPRKMQEALSLPSGDAGIDWEWFGEWMDSFKVTLLRAPEHGKFVNMKNTQYGQYLPDQDYVGKDRIDLLVEGQDDKERPIALTLRYYINVLPREELSKIVLERRSSQVRKELCGKNNYWRISSDSSTTKLALSQNDLVAQLAPLVQFSDLPGSSLAQTTGTGASAQITLDTDDAGHGWFIDYTPYLNEKFLPTSSPYEWIAQPGTYYQAIKKYCGTKNNPWRISDSSTTEPISKTAVKKKTFGICKLFSANLKIDDNYKYAQESLTYMSELLTENMQKRLESNTDGDALGWAYDWWDSFKTTILLVPQHGKLINEGTSTNLTYAVYRPDIGYVGKDRFDLLVEAKDDLGRPIALALHYYINVLPEDKLSKIVQDGTYIQAVKKYCGTKKDYWRISESQNGDSLLSALLSDTQSVFNGFTDLSGSALAQTTGTNAQITLDTDAAGHGWFIDYTPYLNEKFLPTSSPYEWIAQPGSNIEFTNTTFEGAGTGGSVTGYVSFENGTDILKGIAGPR
jgi:hypothetical protein